MAFLAELGGGTTRLRKVPDAERRDRSEANVRMDGKDVLEDEADRWKYFFASGCEGWFQGIQAHTFRSTFVELRRDEAQRIVDHWEGQQRLRAAPAGAPEAAAPGAEEALTAEAIAALEPLRARLDTAVQAECAASSAHLAFVKLSTRSPKDSVRALAKAQAAYQARISTLPPDVAADENERWKVLSEEVTRASAVSSGAEALALCLDSERVYEDLAYALRGPPTEEGQQVVPPGEFGVNLVARAWDPRLKLQSEFRGIAWGGRLTCLCQYFHPLFFPELPAIKAQVEADCFALFDKPAVRDTVQKLGGHCIVDFAWLGPGEVLIVELNPFDGVCLGTFPGSTGLFLWEKPEDRVVMTGEAPFEFRIREGPSATDALKAQCNPAWRRIIYGTSV